jgi:uncharacterized protein
VHIDVRDILSEEVGYSREYKIADESPSLEAVRLTKPVEGEITISRLDSGLLVRGQVRTEIELECHRCLSTFNRPTKVNLKQLFAKLPDDDEFPINHSSIDLAPMIEQEILLGLPIKILCRPDCNGIQNSGDQYTNIHTSTRVEDQARITKGSKRGRT